MPGDTEIAAVSTDDGITPEYKDAAQTDTDAEPDTDKPEPDTTKIQYADIVSVSAERNDALHNRMFFVEYVDAEGASLVDTETGGVEVLGFTPDGALRDESVTAVTVLSRADKPGFAINNGLVTGVWVDVHIGGETPAIVTGRITATEEDMIEVTAYPEGYAFYVDFAYKGMPKDAPFEKFALRDPPLGALAPADAPPTDTIQDDAGEGATKNKGEVFVETSADNEMIVHIPLDAVPDRGAAADLDAMFAENTDIVFGEDLATVTRLTEIADGDKIYTVEAQLSSIEDELAAAIPPAKLNDRARARIRVLVERFRELRESFSAFDDAGDAVGARPADACPLASVLASGARDMHWLVPVLAGRRKVYDIGDLDDYVSDDAVAAATTDFAAAELGAIYDDSVARAHDYDRRLRAIGAATEPVAPPGETERRRCVAIPTNALTQIETVLENAEPLTSIVAKVVKNEVVLAREKFVSHTVDSAVTTLRRDANNKRRYVRVPLGAGDAMCVSGLVALPHRAVEASRAWLPSTNILTRVLRAAALPVKYKIFEKGDEETGGDKAWPVSRMRYVTPSLTNEGGEGVGGLEEDATTALVSAATPSVAEGIAALIAAVSGAHHSVVRVARALEVLAVYPEHFTQVHAAAIEECVAAANERLRAGIAETSRRAPRALRDDEDVGSATPNVIAQIIERDADAREVFSKTYRPRSSATETMAEMHSSADSMALYHAMARRAAAALRLPSSMIDELAKTYGIAADAVVSENNDCTRRVLAKRYDSETAIAADSGRVVYYDSGLDDTPYDLLKIYKPESAGTAPGAEFAEFLAKTLVKHHSVPPSRAPKVAAALIAKKKVVEDGEFAVLAVAGAPQRFFVRKGDTWVRDTSVDETAFFDTNALFCNLSPKCVSIRPSPDATSATCMAMDDAQARVREETVRAARAELDKRFDTDAEVAAERETAEIARLARRAVVSPIPQLAAVANRVAYAMGAAAVAAAPTQHTEDDALRALVEAVLSQPEFDRRQEDIVRLVDHGAFCRLPLLTVPELNEDANWIYSVATNRKVMPSFLYELALVHVAGGDYAAALDEVCYTRGDKVGDTVIDKASGYVIRRIDDDVEDEYNDAGFRVIMRGVLEDDVAAAYVKKTTPEIDDPDTRLIHNVVMTLCANMGIDPAIVLADALSVAKEAVASAVPTKVAYERFLRASKQVEVAAPPAPPSAAPVTAGGAPPAPGAKAPETYDVYKGKRLVACAAAALVVAIQAAVPSVPRGAPLPGCRASFEGFPLSGDETDGRCIEFVACVAAKSKSRVGIWSTVATMSAEMFAVAIRFILTSHILAAADANGVADMFAAKRQFLGGRSGIAVDERPEDTHAWPRFMPPIVAFSVAAAIQPVPDAARAAFVSAVKRGDPEQRTIAAMFDNHTLLFSYAIIESIHTTVAKGRDSFVYSADRTTSSCCGEHPSASTLAYFAREDPALVQRAVGVRELGAVARSVHDCDTAPMFFNADAVRAPALPVPASGYERNAFAAVIKYCLLDTGDPVPATLRFIMQQRPAGYRPDMSLDQKIEVLKSRGAPGSGGPSGGLGPEEVELMVRAVGKGNAAPVVANSALGDPVAALTDFLGHVAAAGSDSLPAPLCDRIGSVLDQAPAAGGRSAVRSRALDALSDYLIQSSIELNTRIIIFMKDHGALARTVDVRNAAKYLDTVQDWKSVEADADTDPDALFASAQFLRNEVVAMSAGIPSQIRNGARPRAAPAHWDLGPKHVYDIAEFLKDERGDLDKTDIAVLGPVFEAVFARTRDIRVLAKLLPVSEPTRDAEGRATHTLFNAPTARALFGWCWRAVLCAYIDAVGDPALMRRADTPLFATMGLDMGAGGAGGGAPRINMDTGDVWTNPADGGDVVGIGPSRAAVTAAAAAFVAALVATSAKRKKHASVSYTEIEAAAYNLKRQDEKRITDRLGGDRAETAIQQQLKKLRLGEWSAGAQKSVYQYDKAAYGINTFVDAEDDMDAGMAQDDMVDDAADAAADDYEDGRALADYGGDRDALDADREADAEYSFRTNYVGEDPDDMEDME